MCMFICRACHVFGFGAFICMFAIYQIDFKFGISVHYGTPLTPLTFGHALQNIVIFSTVWIFWVKTEGIYRFVALL